jgi:hypothetical protein
MQFYTKLSHAKIIIFFPGRVYLQCVFPVYFSDSIYILVTRACFVCYHYHIRKCICSFFKSYSKYFLRNIAIESQKHAVADPSLVDYC